jgi:hypothetical protein
MHNLCALSSLGFVATFRSQWSRVQHWGLVALSAAFPTSCWAPPRPQPPPLASCQKVLDSGPEGVRVRAARQTTGRHHGQTVSCLNSRNCQLVTTQHQQAVYQRGRDGPDPRRELISGRFRYRILNNQISCTVWRGWREGSTVINRDAPDIRPDNLAFFEIRYPAGYRIWWPDIRLDTGYLNSRISGQFVNCD